MKIPIIMYHDFYFNNGNCTQKTKHTLPLQTFEKHLKYLKKKGYETVLLKNLNSEEGKHKKICLTFDDGCESNYYAFKLLEKYGFNGSFFVPTENIGKKGYLNKKQIKEMGGRMEIGSHSHTHPNLAKLDKKSLEEEIKKPKQILKKIIDKEIISFSIPGGSYNKKVLNEIKKTYNNVRSSDYGYYGRKQELFPAIPVINYPLIRSSEVVFSKISVPVLKVIKKIRRIFR